MLEHGVEAPDFSLTDQAGATVSLSALRGRWVVLWWYPEAGTPGCTLQAASLQRSLAVIESDGTIVLGASFDAPAKNNDFACDQSLEMCLLSDELMQVGTAYGVVRSPDDPHVRKPMRQPFIIDPEGKIAHAEDATGLELTRYGDHILETLQRLRVAGQLPEPADTETA